MNSVVGCFSMRRFLMFKKIIESRKLLTNNENEHGYFAVDIIPSVNLT